MVEIWTLAVQHTMLVFMTKAPDSEPEHFIDPREKSHSQDVKKDIKDKYIHTYKICMYVCKYVLLL